MSQIDNLQRQLVELRAMVQEKSSTIDDLREKNIKLYRIVASEREQYKIETNDLKQSLQLANENINTLVLQHQLDLDQYQGLMEKKDKEMNELKKNLAKAINVVKSYKQNPPPPTSTSDIHETILHFKSQLEKVSIETENLKKTKESLEEKLKDALNENLKLVAEKNDEMMKFKEERRVESENAKLKIEELTKQLDLEKKNNLNLQEEIKLLRTKQLKSLNSDNIISDEDTKKQSRTSKKNQASRRRSVDESKIFQRTVNSNTSGTDDKIKKKPRDPKNTMLLSKKNTLSTPGPLNFNLKVKKDITSPEVDVSKLKSPRSDFIKSQRRPDSVAAIHFSSYPSSSEISDTPDDVKKKKGKLGKGDFALSPKKVQTLKVQDSPVSPRKVNAEANIRPTTVTIGGTTQMKGERHTPSHQTSSTSSNPHLVPGSKKSSGDSKTSSLDSRSLIESKSQMDTVELDELIEELGGPLKSEYKEVIDWSHSSSESL